MPGAALGISPTDARCRRLLLAPGRATAFAALRIGELLQRVILLLSFGEEEVCAAVRTGYGLVFHERLHQFRYWHQLAIDRRVDPVYFVSHASPPHGSCKHPGRPTSVSDDSHSPRGSYAGPGRVQEEQEVRIRF